MWSVVASAIKIMPIPVKTLPRFKCQFCLSYRAALKAVDRHEGICWQNPNRYCDFCENKGVIEESYPEVIGSNAIHSRPCPYCSKEDKAVTASLIALKQDASAQTN